LSFYVSDDDCNLITNLKEQNAVMPLILSLVFILLQNNIPFKSKDEFEIKLDYQFKQRQSPESTYNAGGRKQATTTSVLPYLILHVKVLAPGDGVVRLKVKSNLMEDIVNKKVEVGSSLLLDLGFTVDMKDNVTANEYQLYFVSADKTPLAQIFIRIDSDGNFFVNNEKRGRF
jgi:hypothetical protein